MYSLPIIWLALALPAVGNETTKPLEYAPAVFESQEQCQKALKRASPPANVVLKCVSYIPNEHR